MDALVAAMNMRKKKKHVSLLFDIFDGAKTGTIEHYDLQYVSRQIDNELEGPDIKQILYNCSSNLNQITKDEFYTIMTREE